MDGSMAAAFFLVTLGGFLAFQSALCDTHNNLLTYEEKTELLNLHNEARVAVGVGPLRWDEGLAVAASEFAARPAGKDPASCDLSQAAQRSSFGSNQAVKNVVSQESEVMKSWVDVGRQNYDHESNTCATGYQNRCDSYKQVVWSETKELGCAKAGCGKDGSLTICLYYPPGNSPGNRPY